MVVEGSFAVVAPAPLAPSTVTVAMEAMETVRASPLFVTYNKSHDEYTDPPVTPTMYAMITKRVRDICEEVWKKVGVACSGAVGGVAGWFAAPVIVTSAGVVAVLGCVAGFIAYVVFPPVSEAAYNSSGAAKACAFVGYIYAGYKLLKSHGEQIVKSIRIMDDSALSKLTAEHRAYKTKTTNKMTSLEKQLNDLKRKNKSVQQQLDELRNDVAVIVRNELKKATAL